jgi:SpoVK/Ycf46/Vps4 family AAA+-type ATPase
VIKKCFRFCRFFFDTTFNLRRKTMPLQNLRELMETFGLSADNVDDVTEMQRALAQVTDNPQAAALDLCRARKHVRDACAAVEGMENLLKQLVEGNATLHHLESVRRGRDGQPRALCRAGSQLRELGVHPDVDLDTLERLQPWEYVCVHEDVVIDVWCDDPLLLVQAQGDIVEFKGFADRENFQVRVGRPGHDESIATLAGPLRIEVLEAGSRLVLQRDDPRWAIAALPAEHAESRFEVPLDRVHTRLEQLAGINGVAEKFIEDVLLRVVFSDVRGKFDVQALKGAILYSYKPGMGKTSFARALAVWLRDFGQEAGFDTVLYQVKPNQLKSMWHGEDARIVREDLFGSIRARQAAPRQRPLVQLLVFDEVDSLQKRSGSERMVASSAHSDALEALLVELDGLVQARADTVPVHLLVIGLTNRPDRLEEALKRPGRFGDLVLEMPDIDSDTAEAIMAVYAGHPALPWQTAGAVRAGLPMEVVRAAFLRPAVSRVFPAVVARYYTENQRSIDVTAGQILAAAHYEAAMNRAKRRAALRALTGLGVPAVTFDDVIDSLLDTAVECARQMEADPAMLIHQLRIRIPVTNVVSVPKTELEQHRFLKIHSA